jgi:tetrahydromethanopterin S-methyltransferase subunit G
MGCAVAEEKMSDGEIRYRFQTIDKRLDHMDERLDNMDATREKRSELTWSKALGLATIVAMLLAAIVGAWITTKGIK